MVRQLFPKGPCTQIVYTLALKYLYRDYIKADVYTIWVHGPLGIAEQSSSVQADEDPAERCNRRVRQRMCSGTKAQLTLTSQVPTI